MKRSIDIQVTSTRWRAQPRAKSTIVKAIAAAADMLKREDFELSVVLTSDRSIRVLNRDWRGFDKATNVLSFPALPQPPRRVRTTKAVARPNVPIMLGDIVIAYETVVREAKAERKPFPHHLSHLAVHGFLHLLGYDHEQNHEADAMERLERRVLARLTIPDPYADTAAS
jgi:probable rRNA maturation factor